MLTVSWSQIGYAAQRGLLTLMFNPLLYIGCLLMLLERARAAKQERQLFGARISRVWRPVLGMWLQGIVVGMMVSVLCIAAGVVVTPLDVGVASAATLLLGLVRFRWFSGVYGIGLLLFGSLVLRWLHLKPAHGSPAWLVQLTNVNISSWLVLTAALFLAEAVLLWANRKRRPGPAYVLGKRGRPVGAFLMQWTFMVPVCVLAPGSNPLPHVSFAAAWPFLAVPGGVLASGWSLAAIPLFVGYSGFAITTLATERASAAARGAVFAGIVLAADAYAVWRFGTVYGLVGIAVLLFARERTVWRMRRRETIGEPLYASAPNGVRVLATNPGSVADEMGLLPREVITHVNQVAVHSVYDLHFAFAQNPAYAKLQVQDDRGELRFTGKPVYSGSRVQLGLILVPDEATNAMYKRTGSGLFQTLYARVTTREPTPDWADLETAPTIEV